MEFIRINNETLKKSKLVGSGYESSIFLLDGYIYKIFNDNILNSDLRVKSKINKLNYLHYNCNFDNICYPLFLIYNEFNKFIGYGMNYYDEKINIKNYLCSNVSLEDKIKMYKKLEKEVLSLAKKGVFVVDNNLRNFVLAENNKIIVMDIDSVSTFDHRTECLPTYFFDYYYTRFNDKLDYHFVKYTLALQFLSSVNKTNREIIRYFDLNNDIVKDKLVNIFEQYDLKEIKHFFNDNEYDKPLSKLLTMKL